MPYVIRSLVEGFRRAGVAHSRTPTRYADAHFSAPQLAALKAEPMLVVDKVTDASLLTRIDGVIRGMHFREFSAGKPVLARLNELLAEAEIPPVDQAGVDAAVVRLTAASWTAPTDPGP